MMKIGVIKEIKDQENRVAVTPDGVKQLIRAGHNVLVEMDAGSGSGFTDQEYQQAGAELVSTAQAWAVDLVVKVKEPLSSEYQYLGQQIVFTFFHLAGVTKTLTEELLKKGTTAIAYEAVEDEQGRLPILAPMSAIAGNMAITMGVYYLAKHQQGRGVQLGQVLHQRHGKVVVIGDGVVGQHAVRTAYGMGANVFLAGIDAEHLHALQQNFLPEVSVFLSNPKNITEHIVDADLVVGAVLCRGAKAPKIVTETMIKSMQKGAVIVDVSIDQGGCVETSVPTSHSNPVFIKHDVVHYCVANMPGAYPKTATIALAEATLAYILEIAVLGIAGIVKRQGQLKAVNTYQRYITCEQVARDLGMMSQYKPIAEIL
jgi:alanine dehydrogenase